MAKKHEFRQDRTGTAFLSKLYLTQKQRRTLLKWGLYTVFLLVIGVVQDAILSRFRFLGATTDLVPCYILLVCLLEGAQSGCVFTLLASAFYVFSGTAPGTYSLALITLLAVCVSIFRQAFLQKGFAAAFLCSAVFTVLYQAALFLIGLFLGLTPPARYIGFALTAGLSLLSIPLLYPLLLSVQRIGGDPWKD